MSMSLIRLLARVPARGARPAFRLPVLVAVAAFSFAGQACAGIISQWNFNTTVAANNSPAPSIGAGVASIVGMNGGPSGDILLANAGATSASQFSTDPIGTTTTDDAWRVRGVTSNGYSTSNLTSGAQFLASTLGFNTITVTLDVYATGGAPRDGQFEYTLDGSNFLVLGSPTDLRLGNTAITGSTYPEGWQNGLSFNLSSISGAANKPNFGFRFLTAFSPAAFTDNNGTNHGADTAFQRTDEDATKAYDATKGNLRFDMVTFNGTAVPEPSTIVLAGLGLLGIGFFYTRRALGNRAQ
jgi:hypothetical protein